MRVAALYDIHANLPALEAVLDEIRALPIERIVVGGDVLPGPMPRETIARLLDLDLPVQFIHGNGDRVVRAQMAGVEPTEVPEPFRDIIRWNAAQLGRDEEQLLAMGIKKDQSKITDKILTETASKQPVHGDNEFRIGG